jgi:hypothetical protein
MTRIAVAFLTMALSLAGAKSYTVNLFQPAVLAGTELKVGEYKLELNGDKVQLKNGRLTVEANVKVENTPEPNRSTSLRLEDNGGRLHIREIRLRGTSMKLVVN